MAAPARRTPGKPERVIVQREGRTVHVWRIRSASDEEGMDWLAAHNVRVNQIIYPQAGGWYDLSGQPTDAYGNPVGTTRPGRPALPVDEKSTRAARGRKPAVRAAAQREAGVPARQRKTETTAARRVAKGVKVPRKTTRRR